MTDRLYRNCEKDSILYDKLAKYCFTCDTLQFDGTKWKRVQAQEPCMTCTESTGRCHNNDDVKSQWVECPDCNGNGWYFDGTCGSDEHGCDKCGGGDHPTYRRGTGQVLASEPTPAPWPLTGTDAEKLKQYMSLAQKVMDADKKRIAELVVKLEGCDCCE